MAHPTDVPAFGDKNKATGVGQLSTVQALNKKLDTMRRGRQLLENQWKLNLAFYKGRQYAYFNRATRRLENLPVEDGEKPRYRVRLVNNQIVSGTHSLLSKLTKTKPQFFAEPGSGGDADIKASQMAEKLMEFWWSELSLDDKLEEALLWSIITGQGYWKITWDAQAGKAMRFTLGPDGKPITDDPLKDLFRANLATQGIEPQEKVVYLGDIKVEAISPFDVYLDPTARTFDDSKYVICTHHLDPDEIQARWKIDLQPDSVSATPDQTLPLANSGDASEPNVVKVHLGYFKPQPALPKGRYVVFTKDKILEDGPWPYPFTELPIVKFPGLRIPGSVYDSSVVEHAIPLQKELNRTLSQIVEYKNLTVKPRIWAPTGSITTRLTSEPGALYEYNPIGDHRPEVEKLPSMPPYIFDHLTGIRNGLQDMFFISDITQGTPPPNVEAGIAIDLLQEMATDRLAPVITLMEAALARSGQLMLSLAQEYYIEPRLMKVQGSGGSAQVKRFTQADISGGITIRVRTGSAMPRTRAGKQAFILALIDKGVIPPNEAYKHLDIGDVGGINAMLRSDEDQALREHDKIIEGHILNELSYNDVLTQLENGTYTDPDTGQPVQDPGAAQDALFKAGLQPTSYENFQTHLDVHALFMKSPEFEAMPLQVKKAFSTHYSETLQYFLRLPKPVEYQAVRPTLQIKATAGPTAVADILNKAGVYEVTPQTMTEPALDTWVSDSLDKANAGSSGNSGQPAPPDVGAIADANVKVQDMHHSAEMHQMDMAQRTQLHAEQTRKAAAEADAAEQKAKLAMRTAKEKRINPPKQPSKGKNGK
ncbi:MAG TPA: hypothetical protein VIY48_03150 [Candidatus Paceibacterota bacterium]